MTRKKDEFSKAYAEEYKRQVTDASKSWVKEIDKMFFEKMKEMVGEMARLTERKESFMDLISKKNNRRKTK